MFIGHFGVGLAAKAVASNVSLGTLFLAAQFIDLLWPTLLLLGVERVRIEPGNTAVTPLAFEHYPFSHSLLAVLGWAVLLGAISFRFRRSMRGAVVIGAAVLSHWLLDLLVHRPDLPLYPGATQLYGLGLWSSVGATLAVEVPIFVAGVWLYARITKPRDATGRFALWGLVAFLCIIYLGNLSGQAPPSVAAIAWLGQAQWLLVAWAYWVDRHRRPAVAP
jgi:LexA-binding, inner membrane-associated putative hydrolase